MAFQYKENGVVHIIKPYEIYYKTKLTKNHIAKLTKKVNYYRCDHCKCAIYPDQMLEKVRVLDIPGVGRKAIYPCYMCHQWGYKFKPKPYTIQTEGEDVENE